MIKLIASVVTASALIGGVAYAQQSTTGQNQSNPRTEQQQGPVGENGQGRVVRPRMNSSTDNMSSTTPAPAASSSSGNMNNTGERAPRADRN